MIKPISNMNCRVSRAYALLPLRHHPSSINKILYYSSVELGPEPSYTYFVPGAKKYIPIESFHFKENDVHLPVELAYETWGTLNKEKSNVILLQTGLSASSHAKSSLIDPSLGWWEEFIGPKRSIDTEKFFVVCVNPLGSCYGSTGPSSISPITNRHYGSDFPDVSIQDIVHSQFMLLDKLCISKVHAVVGSSMGGMQSLSSAVLYPQRVSRVVTISACAISHPSTIAQRFAQRICITSDPNYNDGHYYTKAYPRDGMRNARILATISYRSGPEWVYRFGLKRSTQVTNTHNRNNFVIEDYIYHQGDKFADKYDPNSLIYLSKAMDTFSISSLSEGTEPDQQINSPDCDDLLLNAARNVSMPVLVIGVQSDLLFPIFQQQQVARILRKAGNKNVTYYELDSIYGHDTFLLDAVNVGSAVKAHLEQDIT